MAVEYFSFYLGVVFGAGFIFLAILGTIKSRRRMARIRKIWDTRVTKPMEQNKTPDMSTAMAEIISMSTPTEQNKNKTLDPNTAMSLATAEIISVLLKTKK